MSEPQLDRRPDIRLYLGGTGSGKTHQAKRDIAAHRGRVIAWDWKHYDYPELEQVTLEQLARRALTAPRLRYCPDVMWPARVKPADRIAWQFDRFCRIAWEVQRADPRTECLLVADELQEVTSASYAPPAWRRLVAQGRVFGFSIVGITPRPALVDMSIRTNATLVRCGRLLDALDARAIGQQIGVDYRELQRLPDRAAYVFDGKKSRLERPR